MVRDLVPSADACPDPRLAGHHRWSAHPDLCTDRQRQDAHGIPVLDRSAGHHTAAGEPGTHPRPLHLAAARPRVRRREESPSPADGHPASGRAPGSAVRATGRCDAHRRHQLQRSSGTHPPATRLADHYARKPVPDAHVVGGGDADGRRHGHHRRDPRDGHDQARRTSDVVDGTAGGGDGQPAAANRAVGNATPTRGGRALPRRFQRAGYTAARRDRRCRYPQDAGNRGRRAGRGHGLARPTGHRTPLGSRNGSAQPAAQQHLAEYLPPHPRARAGPSQHDHLLQRPPPGRALGGQAQRSRRAGRYRYRPRNRPLRRRLGQGPPRLARARATDRRRGSTQTRSVAGDRCDEQPRARHRHGRSRSRDPGRVAGFGQQGAAAHRPRRTSGRRAEPGQAVPQAPRRLARSRCRRPADDEWPDRGQPLFAQSARCVGATDRRLHRRRFWRRPGRGSQCNGAPLRELRRHLRRTAQQHAGSAGRPVPERGVQRTPAAPRVGSNQQYGPRPRRSEAARRHERRHDPRPRPVRRVPPRRHPSRRTRRGDGLRVTSRRDLSARRIHVADRGHHVRTRHRHARAGSARQDAVLAR